MSQDGFLICGLWVQNSCIFNCNIEIYKKQVARVCPTSCTKAAPIDAHRNPSKAHCLFFGLPINKKQIKNNLDFCSPGNIQKIISDSGGPAKYEKLTKELRFLLALDPPKNITVFLLTPKK